MHRNSEPSAHHRRLAMQSQTATRIASILPSETAKCSYQNVMPERGGPRDRVGTLSKNKNVGHQMFAKYLENFTTVVLTLTHYY